MTGALATARRLALGAWLARQGLALVPRSELEDLRRIAAADRQRLTGGRRREADHRLPWQTWLERCAAGRPAEFQWPDPDGFCGVCGTAARERVCVGCGLVLWTVDCQHMLPAPIALGTACGDDPDDLLCMFCANPNW